MLSLISFGDTDLW